MILRDEYPRPQLKRDNWLMLNGEWEFEFDDDDSGLKRKLYNTAVGLNGKIIVPFSYQYPASGIGDTAYHKTLWYKRSFKLSEEQLKSRALLCFNASDYITDVWVNETHIITHKGGFSPFTADITDFVGGDNIITVRCEDSLDPTVPRGKQSWLNEKYGCWYIPNSGIWQSVWIEFFGKDCLNAITLETDIDDCSFGGELCTKYAIADEAKMTVLYENKIIKTQTFSLDGKYTKYDVKLGTLNYVDESFWWTPENPNLFYLDIQLFHNGKLADTVHTRFGMRKISINDKGQICLNNTPYFQRLILDQGYFVEGGLTAPSIDALKKDIVLAKQMGFNGARKHQKYEDSYFYYFADELGFLTWCEMPSAYNFNNDEQFNISVEWQEIIAFAKIFTSIICYVPLNESWGVRKILSNHEQKNFARALYYLTKSNDGTRLVSTNDGWENLDITDIISIHDYSFDNSLFMERYSKDNLDGVYPQHRRLMSEGCSHGGKPTLLDEFGGIAMKSEEQNGNWGYNTGADDRNEFYSRYGNLMEGAYNGLFQGFCYTQLSDVQQEVNGLLDEKHNLKFDANKIYKLTMNIK